MALESNVLFLHHPRGPHSWRSDAHRHGSMYDMLLLLGGPPNLVTPSSGEEEEDFLLGKIYINYRTNAVVAWAD